MKNFLLVLLITTTIILSGCSYSNQEIDQGSNILDDYYEKLKYNCPKDDNCCLSSVEHMKKNNYKLAEENSKGNLVCNEGYSKDMMKCINSYSWCIPNNNENNWDSEIKNLINSGCTLIQFDIDGNTCSLNEEKTEYQYCTEMLSTQKLELPKCISYD